MAPLESAQFFHLIFELSEGYFFIDQILPYFTLSDFKNLFLTSKYIAGLIVKQHHVDYSVKFDYMFNIYYGKNKYRWEEDRKEFPSLLHFANGVRISNDTLLDTLFESVSKYCGEVDKELHIWYDMYYNSGEMLNISGMKNVKKIGRVKASLDNFPALFKLLDGVTVKSIELSSSYFGGDFISKTQAFLENITFGELTFRIKEGGTYSMASVINSLSNLNLDYRNKMHINFGNSALKESLFPQFKACHNLFKFESIIIECPQIHSIDYDYHIFEAFSNSYHLKSSSLTNIEDLAIPKLSNTKPSGLVLESIQLSITSNNNLHVLYTTKYLTELTLKNCIVSFERNDLPELMELKSLNVIKCTFLRNEVQSNALFIESIMAPNLTSLLCSDMKLKGIPKINSTSLTSLNIGKNDLVIIDLKILRTQKNLTNLDLSENQLNNFENIQPIIGKYKTLNLAKNPILKSVLINGNKLEKINNVRLDVTRSSNVTTKPLFSGTDSEIYKQMKSSLNSTKCLPSFYSKKDFLQIIQNPKKLTTLDATNVIFWNPTFSNTKQKVFSEGNSTNVGEVFPIYYQFAIYLNANLQYENCRKWVIFGYDGHEIEYLNLSSEIPYIVREWSFMSSHFEFVKQLRKLYPSNN